MKKKIYISLPIAYHEDDVYERNEKAKRYVEENLEEYDWLSPIDNNHIDDDALGNHLQIERTAYYMGKDVEQVILCDAILMCPGWLESKGCKVEMFVAQTYGKDVLFMPNKK